MATREEWQQPDGFAKPMLDAHLTHAFCETCRKNVETRRDADGYGRRNGPLRYVAHAGRWYGRQCKRSGELVESPDSARGEGA